MVKTDIFLNSPFLNFGKNRRYRQFARAPRAPLMEKQGERFRASKKRHFNKCRFLTIVFLFESSLDDMQAAFRNAFFFS